MKHTLDENLRQFATDKQWEKLVAYAEHGTDLLAANSLGLKSTACIFTARHAVETRALAAGYTPEPRLTGTDFKKPVTAKLAETAEDKAMSLADTRKLRLSEENKALKKKLKDVTKENLSAEEVRERIFNLAAEPTSPPDWVIDDRKKKSGMTGVPQALWTDWHLGEVVVKAETNGINEFDLAIAEQRIVKLVERTIDLCMHHMTNPKYPGIVICLLGDIISGELHPEHTETNELEINPTLLWARNRIAWALTQMADTFGRVFVPVAPGNHGRDPRDKRPRSKRYVYRNADWLLGCMLEQYFKDIGDTRVQFFIPATGEPLWNIYSHRYLGVHGDDLGVQGGDGIIGAIGPIMRGEVKMRHSQAQIDRDYDTLIMGHWHQMLWLPRCIVNNCLKGYDEYARRKLRAVPMPPSQALWFNHPKRGITARWEVFLNDSSHRPINEAWISWEDREPEAFRKEFTP